MIYGIRIREIGVNEFVVTCRDLPECTFTSRDVPTALADAAKAIPGTIELFYRQKKRAIPVSTPIEEGEVPIFIPLRVQTKILLWNTVVSQGMNLTEFAERIGCSRTQAQRLVDFSKSASPENIEKALAELGCIFDVTVEPEPKNNWRTQLSNCEPSSCCGDTVEDET